MRVLVTGGAGFIGSNIVARLHALSVPCTVLDDLSSGREENLRPYLSDITFIRGSITDREAVEEAVRGADAVIHQAADPSVVRSVEDPVSVTRTNVIGTSVLLDAARRQGVGRFVFASSCSVYGNRPEPRKHEELAAEPLSPYAASKLAGEGLCRSFYEVYGLETVVLRYFNIFGPRQDETSQYSAVIPIFITRMLDGKQPVVYGDGMQSRDFCHVDNVVDANLRAAGVTGDGLPGDIFGTVFNIATGQSVTLLDLVSVINHELGTSLEPAFKPSRPGDVRHSLADIGRAENLLGFTPAVSFSDGITKTIDWYRRRT